MEPIVPDRAAPLPAPERSLSRSRFRLSRSRARRLVARLRGTPRLIALLSLGCGLEPLEVLRLEVGDLDLERRRIRVRRSPRKGTRRPKIPLAALPELERLLAVVRRLHAADAARGRASTSGSRLRQWLFPSPRLETNPRTGEAFRPHLDPRRLERAFGAASCALRGRLTVHTNVHTVR